jgi:cytochrome d ubiquinol oxidase subunit II
MIDLASLLAASIVVALTFYTLLGGADFGSGVWDLLAVGPRARQQRELIAEAIGPIWEANHVWLIVAIVILFVCFPPAFAEISTALFIPLTVMLVGIVLRGSAFVFRAYGSQQDAVRRVYGAVFAVASVVTPFFLGIAIGSISSGRIVVADGAVRADFVDTWLGVFPIAMGALVVCLFALLAAVYLAVEAREDALREDFRKRALIAAAVTGALAIVNLFLIRQDAPTLYDGFVNRPWTLLAIGGSVAMGIALIAALWRRRYHIARILAMLQAVCVIWTWAFAQYPYLVLPNLTIQQAAGPDITLAIVLAGLTAGGFLLFPSLYLLYRVFKGERAFSVLER